MRPGHAVTQDGGPDARGQDHIHRGGGVMLGDDVPEPLREGRLRGHQPLLHILPGMPTRRNHEMVVGQVPPGPQDDPAINPLENLRLHWPPLRSLSPCPPPTPAGPRSGGSTKTHPSAVSSRSIPRTNIVIPIRRASPGTTARAGSSASCGKSSVPPCAPTRAPAPASPPRSASTSRQIGRASCRER